MPIRGAPAQLRTARLRLRDWRPSDREPFAAINGDPVVMEHFPGLLSRRESDRLADCIEEQLRFEGWGLWAVEIVADGEFAGFVGLSRPAFEARFTPAVEVGWRLAPAYWHHGYATEGAAAAITLGFDTLQLSEIVSFTSSSNLRSQRVMERLGMRRDPNDDFLHPNLPPRHHLGPHVLYRIAPTDWATRPAEMGAFGGAAVAAHRA